MGRLCRLLLGGVAFMPIVAHAQAEPRETGASAEESSRSGGLEDIVVTAQRRGENLQQVPISIAAITSEALTRSGVRSSDDLAVVTPGLNIRRQTIGSLVFIRGIGSGGAQAGQESSIAVFVDGVYQPSPQNTTQALFNLERIEVLKGPQGTLFGRNATGGAIQYITKDPSFDPTAKISLGFGNKQTVEVNGYVAGGLTDSIALDLAGYYRNQMKGWGTNLVTGNDLNKGRDAAFRSKLLWRLGDDTVVKIAGDYAEYRGSEGIVQRPVASSSLADGSMGALPNFYDSIQSFDPYVTLRSWGGSATIEHDFDFAKFVSITGYRNTKGQLFTDVDTTPQHILEIPGYTEIARQFSQELQLGNSDGNVKWLVGLFFLSSQVGYDPFLVTGTGFSPGLDGIRIDGSIQRTKSYAAFGQATWEFAPGTSLTLGARYSIDKRKHGGALFIDLAGDSPDAGFIPGAPANAFDQKATFKEPTWRVALDHHISQDVLVYASYNRGFKSGIFNTTAPGQPPVRPEKLDAFEIGVKSTLFDNHLRLNAAGFYYDYSNIQLISQNGAAQLLLNAAKARVYGFEVTADAAITDNLRLGAGFSYLHNRYQDFPFAPNLTPNPLPPYGNLTGSADASGTRMIFTPDYTFNLTATYTIPTQSIGEFDLNAAYSYTDDFIFAPDGNGRLRQPGYGTLNASIDWRLPGDQLTIRLWGRNLTDEDYLVSAFSQSIGDTGVAGYGRSYGAALVFEY